jgi:cytochrome c oxidase subunit II
MVVLMRAAGRLVRHASVWTVVALAMLTVASGRSAADGGASGPAASARTQAGEPRRVIRITAERFSFTPSEIELREGEEVELQLRSDDTSHGFRIVGTKVRVAVPKRGKGDVSVVFKAERAGRYEFECFRMCGAGHDFMRGVIIVRAGEAAGAR